ncbi:MAG: tetratricopeptide repeat protein [bacterium]|nr:tetratricopeptide repeat protein [bacterium]
MTRACRLRLATTLAVTGLSILPACRQEVAEESTREFERATSLGQAHFENRDARSAVASFSRATELEAASAPAWRNLARAYLLARDEEAAEAALERAASITPEAASTSYLLGLTLARRSRFEEALPHLEAAVRLDPRTAALRFQLASAYQATGNHENSTGQLRETLALDPLHAGAHYKLLGYARRADDSEALAFHQHELERLRRLFGDESRTPEVLEKCVHTLAETGPRSFRPVVEPLAVRFRDVTGETFDSEADRVALASTVAAAVLEVDPSARVTIFTVQNGGGASLLSADRDGWVRKSIDLPPWNLGTGAEVWVAVGDFHNVVPATVRYDPAIHAANDVLILHPEGARLLRATGGSRFEDITVAAGLGNLKGHQARWVDYEYDGDLDLAVAAATGVELWQNDGEGRFVEVSAAVGIVDPASAIDLATADLDGNLGVDLVVAHGPFPTRVFENQRAGEFRGLPVPPGPWPEARVVLADDVDNDGHVDSILIHRTGVTIMPGAGAGRVHLELPDLEPETAALVDIDNDGWLDLLVGGLTVGHTDAAGTGGFRLWRNMGSGAWRDVTAETGLDARTGRVLQVARVDFDADGDTDLLATTEAGLRLWQNDGGNRNRQLKIRLQGTKTNPAGLDARLELRQGAFRVSRVVSTLPIEIGIGQRDALDAVRVVWTNGIVDNQIDPALNGGVVTVVEKNVATGSCPFLYAWDGERFRFVTDVLGNSPVGLSIMRGVPLDADPDELVWIGPESELEPRDGAFILQVTEEMREVLYLDQARLVAVDHDRDVEVHSIDKLMPAPFPPSELHALTGLRTAVSALGSDGVDRTSELAELDGVFAPSGVPLPPPWRGTTRPLALDLDFGNLDTERPLVLALTGWLQYGDASTNIALSQGSPAKVIPPRLEAETASGWRSLDVIVGMPAGKTKTILVDLEGKLPPGSRRLRLATSFEIRWDRIALGEHLPATAFTRHNATPVAASLAWRGFSEIRSRRANHPTTPDFEAVSDHPPWRHALEGWATRYGDVLDLVRERDGRLAIVGGGDAVELAFPADAFPPPVDDRVRTFFFFSVGWDKDGDHNVIDGDKIGPFPEASSADSDWRLDYNTRWRPRDLFAEGSKPSR